MVVYNFKKIAPIPPANEFIDIILTRTQRKTPTVIHPGYKITRIRSFYMRKVKFTQQTIDEKLMAIVRDFPRLNDIHPFYADLMNILYDKDHFKLALGQINKAKNVIAGISKDYLRLMKYGDSLYRCKQLKKAALGRMCTVIKKLKAAFGYLEEVRKHISRLPALDPNTRTLLLSGYPNVGKSSFMNKITRADVDVQPYAFTTKALFVGHTDHRYLRWQVVDTPGILDRALEERNTIEMQAITALAHLRCCVLYFLDISEQCGYSIDQQIRLFESIRPLFAQKQVVVVANKTDVMPFEKLPAETRSRIEQMAAKANAELVPMSNINEENVGFLKSLACDKLLEARIDMKLSKSNKLQDDLLSRINVVIPKRRDDIAREAFLPPGVEQKGEKIASSKVTEKELMWQSGGPGVYACDYRKYYTLEDEEWRFDTIPEIMDGKNVQDFFDDDIQNRLDELEREEEALEASGAYDLDLDMEDEIDDKERLFYETIVEKQTIARKQARLNTSNSLPTSVVNRHKSTAEMASQLENAGLPSSRVLDRLSVEGRGRKRDRSRDDNMDGDFETSVVSNKAESRRSRSATRGPREGSVAVHQERLVQKSKRTLDRRIVKYARSGEADRTHYQKLVKHLNSGKRSLGTSTIGR